MRILAQTVGSAASPLAARLTNLVARSTPLLAGEDDVGDTADDLIDAVWQASRTVASSRTGAGAGASLVRQSALGPLARLSADDGTVVFELLDARRRAELEACRYLRYRSAHRATVSATDLFHQTTIWASADVQTRYWIQQRLAWPVRLVVPDHDPSVVCGVLLPGPTEPFPQPGPEAPELYDATLGFSGPPAETWPDWPNSNCSRQSVRPRDATTWLVPRCAVSGPMSSVHARRSATPTLGCQHACGPAPPAMLRP